LEKTSHEYMQKLNNVNIFSQINENVEVPLDFYLISDSATNQRENDV